MTSSAIYPNPIHLFEMKGRDARDFLNRLTTVNIRELITGDFKPGFLLNPQGKARGSFRVAAVSDPADSFLIEIEGGKDSHWKTSFLGLLDQFTFTEKYEIVEKTGLKCAWIFGFGEAPENTCKIRGPVTLLHGSKRVFGTSWMSVWGEPSDVDAFLKSESIGQMSDADFEKMRIVSLAPRIDVELLLDSNPLELGLRDGISDNKGCYPGQEVIEKIISLGSPAKRLAKLVGAGNPPNVGDKVFLGEGEVGQITSVTSIGNGFAALALLRKNAAHEGQALTIRNEIPATVERISHYE